MCIRDSLEVLQQLVAEGVGGIKILRQFVDELVVNLRVRYLPMDILGSSVQLGYWDCIICPWIPNFSCVKRCFLSIEGSRQHSEIILLREVPRSPFIFLNPVSSFQAYRQ